MRSFAGARAQVSTAGSTARPVGLKPRPWATGSICFDPPPTLRTQFVHFALGVTPEVGPRAGFARAPLGRRGVASPASSHSRETGPRAARLRQLGERGFDYIPGAMSANRE